MRCHSWPGVFVDGRWVPPISGGTGIEEIALIAAVVGTAASAATTAYAGSRSAAAARYNQRVAQQEAQSAQAAGKAAADQQRERYRQILASNRAQTGAAGVDIATGSPVQVAQANTQQAELNALWTEYEGATRAYGLRNEAELYRMRAQSATVTGLMGAADTALSGAYSLYRTYPRTSRTTAAPPDMGSWGYM